MRTYTYMPRYLRWHVNFYDIFSLATRMPLKVPARQRFQFALCQVYERIYISKGPATRANKPIKFVDKCSRAASKTCTHLTHNWTLNILWHMKPSYDQLASQLLGF